MKNFLTMINNILFNLLIYICIYVYIDALIKETRFDIEVSKNSLQRKGYLKYSKDGFFKKLEVK